MQARRALFDETAPHWPLPVVSVQGGVVPEGVVVGGATLARDRFGVRPLLYAERHGNLYFASEAKAIFATGEVRAEPDL